MTTLRLFVVSSLPAIRAGLRALLESAPNVVVAGEARSLNVPDLPGIDESDVAVIDAPLDTDFSWEMVDRIIGSRLGVLLLGPVESVPNPISNLRGRAWGYLARDAGKDQLIAAAKAVSEGLVCLDPRVDALRARHQAATAQEIRDVEGEDLTEREREVLALVAIGLANKTIARRLSISEHTVKFHVASILSKLGASSRTEAVHLATRRGMIAL